jgi:hypothetical protein
VQLAQALTQRASLTLTPCAVGRIHRRDITSALAGVLTAAAWWTLIDGNIYQIRHTLTPVFYWYYYLPGIFATIGMIM